MYKGWLTAFKGDRKKALCKCCDWMDSLNKSYFNLYEPCQTARNFLITVSIALTNPSIVLTAVASYQQKILAQVSNALGNTQNRKLLMQSTNQTY